MTAQIPDSILLQDKKFSIVGMNGNELFNSVDFDLYPFRSITSWWRGYVETKDVSEPMRNFVSR